MIVRALEKNVISYLKQFPSVAILGPRQVGKTTLAKKVASYLSPTPLYLDLERPSDIAKLADPELYLQSQEHRLVIIDEIQKLPGLFSLLRSLIDERRQKGIKAQQFLLLGSASRDLLHQSSESLAGRIIYTELSGFNLREIGDTQAYRDLLWLRGGFPDSYLASSENVSMSWRQSFIRTYLERDIPQMGPRIPAETLRRFWTMLAHNQGELLNASRLAMGLGVSIPTIGRYLDLLADLFLIRLLRPWSRNTGKRLVKAPKVYIRDSGITHALLNLKSLDDVLAHPVAGGSWENFIIENIISTLNLNTVTPWFYRTSAGAEIDLLLEKNNGNCIAIEIKRSLNPAVSRGFYNGCEDTKASKSYVVYPGHERYPLSQTVEAVPLMELLKDLSMER